MAVAPYVGIELPYDSRSIKLAYAALAVAVGVALGLGISADISLKLIIAGAIAPFIVVVALARPHLAVTLYAVAVYSDLLSLVVQYQGMPPLARFVGFGLLASVLGYRLFVRREQLTNDTMTRWMIAYGIMITLGLFYARSSSGVMTDVIEFIRNFITYILIINTLTTVDRVRKALWSVLGMGVVLALLSIYQSVTGRFDNNFSGLAQYRVSEITGTSDAARPSGPVGDANYFGQMLLFLVPVALYLLFEGRTRGAKLAGLLASGSLIVAVIFTYSRGDALALIVVLLAAAIYKRPKASHVVVGALTLILIVPFLPQNYVTRLSTVLDVVQGNQQTVLSELSIRGRAGAVQAALEMFADHPLLGVGRENYPLYQPQYLAGTRLAYQSKGIPPHDLYLEVAAETGLVGIVIMGGIFLVTAGALREARRRFLAKDDRQQAELVSWVGIGLLGYMVSSLFLHGAFLYMLWLQVSFIIALRQVARSKTQAV